MKKPSPLQTIVDCGRQFYDRRWMWGTAGNLSTRLSSTPLKIAITPSGLNKGRLRAKDLLSIPPKHKTHPRGRVPSAETLIHQAVYEAIPEANAVFHVHPVYATLISRLYGHPTERRLLSVEWFEMMKGVGVGEEAAELGQIPIFPNWQDVSLVAKDFKAYVRESQGKVLPILLIYNHGLTGWGKTAEAAQNHLEIAEYVCQYLYLRRLSGVEAAR